MSSSFVASFHDEARRGARSRTPQDTRPYTSGVSRTLLVGFDGATLGLCDRWMGEGGMRTLAAIMDRGCSGMLRSTIPHNSAVAWTSLSTGANPGRHGIFDFVLPRPGGYGYRVATRQDRHVPALWNYASEAGARVAVVNIPMTFPAEPVNGIMVSGMDAPGLDERAVHPPGLLQELRRVGGDYRIMSKAAHAAEAGDFELAGRELIEVLEARSRFVRGVAGGRDADLVMVNFEPTDGSHHFFWQHLDPAHPRHDPRLGARFGGTIARVYEACDRELGRLIETYDPDNVLVVSDHGGGPSSDWVLFMNDWLVSCGFLAPAARRSASLGQRLYALAKKRLSVPARQALQPVFGRLLERAKDAALFGDFEWPASRAYAHMQPAVRLNMAGREPLGTVTERDRDATLDEIAAAARAARLPSGEAMFPAAYRAEEVYAGNAPGGPDLVLELAPGLHIRSRNTTGRPGFARRLSDLGMYLPSGVHTRWGMFAAAGSGVERLGRQPECDILQVAPSVLALMGVPMPPLDGEPFPFVTPRPDASRTTCAGTGRAYGEDLTAAEEAEVMDRLRGLGYVD
jgi:predicted AlkP superfamily phosphohydrolase/phosphomutase